MFLTTLQEIAGGTTADGKKASSKGNSNALRNNYEFTKLFRDVEAEINCVRIGQRGKTKEDRHPKMVKTLELVGVLGVCIFYVAEPSFSSFNISLRQRKTRTCTV